MISLVVNVFCLYVFVGIGICAYRDPKVRLAIIEILWMSLKWGFRLKPEVLVSLITKEVLVKAEVPKEESIVEEAPAAKEEKEQV